MTKTMTDPIRTPDDVPETEVQRVAWHLRGEADPVDAVVAALSPRKAFDFLRDDHAELQATPEYQAWAHDSAAVTGLRKRIEAVLEGYRNPPAVLTAGAGLALAEGLAARCWHGGTVTWEGVAHELEHDERIRTLAEGLGYPERLTLADVLPAVHAAWWKIAAARED